MGRAGGNVHLGQKYKKWVVTSLRLAGAMIFNTIFTLNAAAIISQAVCWNDTLY